MNTITAAIASVITGPLHLLSPVFPSPCKGEDQGEGPYTARECARFKIPPLLSSELPQHLDRRHLHHCINWLSWKIGISTASIINTMMAAIASVITGSSTVVI